MSLRRWLTAGFLVLALVALLLIPSHAVGGTVPWAAPSFLVGAALLGYALERWGRRAWLLLGLAAGAAALAYALTQHPATAFVLVTLWWAALFAVGRAVPRRGRWLSLLLVSVAAAALPALIWQIEGHFSDEEFQVVLVVAMLGGMSLLAQGLMSLFMPRAVGSRRAWGPFLGLSVGVPALLGLYAFWLYPQTFYGTTAPAFAGITEREPFLCVTLPPEAVSKALPSSEALFHEQVEGIRALSDHSIVDLGWLALATGESGWAEQFRIALLDEAAQQRFTEPAHSVKYFQLYAATRAYYYHESLARFPALFSPDEQARIRAWFAAINRRAMTVEWVDVLYSSAFGDWQVGPYANQEIGNGLIAALQAYGLEDPALREANQRYLASGHTGWRWRWRNSDDSYEYERVWIESATLQHPYHGESDAAYDARRRLSFEWLLLQTLPDGTAPAYNNPQGTLPPYATMLQGASVLQDGRFLTLAARMMAAREGSAPPYSQVGLTAAPVVAAAPLTDGSCLLYGETGLPARAGPLAPDKIVFRDGWETDDNYLLINLRFAGWHRYKGTNSVSVIAADGGTLLSDVPTASLWKWVPAGRQKFRDKRIARGQTNGLLIPAVGFAATLHHLTGLGEAWAQDPPPYATVARFTTLPRWDSSVTIIEGWHGWQHKRTIHFLHDGPMIILDEADGGGGHAAISWNSEVSLQQDGDGWRVGEGRLLSIPLEPTTSQTQGQRVVLTSQSAGSLAHMTLFLPPSWADAALTHDQSANGLAVLLRATTPESLTVFLNRTPSQWQALGGIESDAEALLVRDEQLCTIGGTRALLQGQAYTLPAAQGCQPLR